MVSLSSSGFDSSFSAGAADMSGVDGPLVMLLRMLLMLLLESLEPEYVGNVGKVLSGTGCGVLIAEAAPVPGSASRPDVVLVSGSASLCRWLRCLARESGLTTFIFSKSVAACRGT